MLQFATGGGEAGDAGAGCCLGDLNGFLRRAKRSSGRGAQRWQMVPRVIQASYTSSTPSHHPPRSYTWLPSRAAGKLLLLLRPLDLWLLMVTNIFLFHHQIFSSPGAGAGARWVLSASRQLSQLLRRGDVNTIIVTRCGPCHAPWHVSRGRVTPRRPVTCHVRHAASWWQMVGCSLVTAIMTRGKDTARLRHTERRQEQRTTSSSRIFTIFREGRFLPFGCLSAKTFNDGMGSFKDLY